MTDPSVENFRTLLAQVAQLTNTQHSMMATINALQRQVNNLFTSFETPDQIKIIPEFSGNKNETLAWIEDTQVALTQFEDFELESSYKHIIRVIKSKIVGDAREVLIASGNPSEWTEIKEILLTAFDDKRDITSHLQTLFSARQGKQSLTEYFRRVKALDTSIKTTVAQMDDFKGSTEAVNKLISLITMTRYADGLNEDNLAMYVRSYRPKSLEKAHEITIQQSNALFRQRMENRQTPPGYSGFNSSQKHYKTEPYNTDNHPQNPGPSKPSSGKFNNFDEDVSMRANVSKMQVNSHKTKNKKYPDESHKKPDEINRQANTSMLSAR